MKELELNTAQKNQIEEDKLRAQLFKLGRSGRRATHQISRSQHTITQHCLNVTCKTDKVTDERKINSFQIMKSSRPRPLSAIHIPSSDSVNGEGKVFRDRLGRPAVDVERMKQERSDRFYHHKIDKLMTMMESHKLGKRRPRSKSVPNLKIDSSVDLVSVPFETFDINNIPDARPMTASDAEFQFKKIRATLDKRPSTSSVTPLLYGEDREETIIKKNFNPNRQSISAGSGRRMSSQNFSIAKRRSQTSSFIDDDQLSDISEYETQVMQERAKHLDRRDTFKSNQLNCIPVSATQIGRKIKNYQDKKYPSRFLHPNPDHYSRLLPYPVILEKNVYDDFCKRVERIKTTTEMKRDLDNLINQQTFQKPVNAWDHNPQFMKKFSIS